MQVYVLCKITHVGTDKTIDIVSVVSDKEKANDWVEEGDFGASIYYTYKELELNPLY